VKVDLEVRDLALEQNAPSGNLHVFVLIDALGWAVLEGQQFLNDALPFRQPVRTVLGFSSGAIPTILTGVPPALNGHWNLFYYDPKHSPFRWLKWFGFLPDSVLNHRVSQKLIKELGRHVLGMGPLFECCVTPRLLPWFNWVEKRNIYGPGGISGAPSIFDQLAERKLPYRVYSYHHAKDEDILRQAQRDIEAQAASFYFVYLCEFDSVLHNNIGDQEKLKARLDWYATGLTQILRAARQIDPQAQMTLFSDHGMTPVSSRFDLVREIEQLGFSMPGDYLAVYDSTMARFWFFSAQARAGITGKLKSLTCGRILPDAELQKLGVFFPDRRYGEMVFLLEPGCLIAHSDFNGKGWDPIGMHGYHPDDPYSDGVLLSSHRPPAPVRTVADVYHCLQQAIVPARNR